MSPCTRAAVWPVSAARPPDDREVGGDRAPRHRDLVDREVADKGVAVAIENEAPGGSHRHDTDLVGRHRLRRGRTLEHLQRPEPEAKEPEEGDHYQAGDTQAQPRSRGCRGLRVEHPAARQPPAVQARLPCRTVAGPPRPPAPGGGAGGGRGARGAG